MKRYSEVVRHPRKLTQWKADVIKVGKKKEKRIELDELVLTKVEPRKLSRSVRHVVHAWNALAYADRSVETLMNVLEVLLGSYANPCEFLNHPTEVEGDIRPYLCDAVYVRRLLLELSPFWGEAVDMMELSVKDRKALMQNVPAYDHCINPKLLLHHGWSGEMLEHSSSPIYQSHLFPWMKGMDFLEMKLRCDQSERADCEEALALVIYSHQISLKHWLDLIIASPEQRHYALVYVFLLPCNIGEVVIDEPVSPVLSLAYYREEKQGRVGRVQQVIGALFGGVRPCIIEQNMMLENQWGLVKNLNLDSETTLKSEAILSEIGSYCSKEEILFEFVSSRMQQASCEALLENLKSSSLSEVGMNKAMSLLIEQARYFEGKYDYFIWYIERVFHVYETVDEKYYGKLYNMLYYRFPNVTDLHRRNAMMSLIVRLCSNKMQRNTDLDDLLRDVMDQEIEVLFNEQVDDAGLKHLDTFFRSQISGELFLDGWKMILKMDVGLFFKGLRYAPKVTLASIVELASLEKEVKESFTQWLEYHPLREMSADLLENRVEYILRHSDEHRDIELPHKLSESIRCGRKLRTEVYARQVEILEKAEMRMLFTEIPAEVARLRRLLYAGGTGVESFTSRFIHSADENRRSGRRILNRYQHGGDAAIMMHPSNIQWLKKPKYFWRPAVWLIGIRETMEIEKIGKVYFQTEHRFEEAIKMGQYVNSCLSLGGCNQHSAISNAADANKQVLYLRDEKGKFIARQLLAMTKEKKLACFHVYHSGHRWDREVIHSAFAALNKEFATKLGVEIQKEHEYEIENVVCKDWYDDGIWITREQA